MPLKLPPPPHRSISSIPLGKRAAAPALHVLKRSERHDSIKTLIKKVQPVLEKGGMGHNKAIRTVFRFAIGEENFATSKREEKKVIKTLGEIGIENKYKARRASVTLGQYKAEARDLAAKGRPVKEVEPSTAGALLLRKIHEQSKTERAAVHAAADAKATNFAEEEAEAANVSINQVIEAKKAAEKSKLAEDGVVPMQLD